MTYTTFTTAPTIEQSRSVDAEPNGSDAIFNLPPRTITISIPDLFSSFLSIAPRVNPLYAEVKTDSDAWISKNLDTDQKISRKIQRLDFTWFCSVAAPDAGKEGLRILCDWGNWAFQFDEIFDSGHLRSDPVKARQLIDNVLSIMREDNNEKMEKEILVELHDDVWCRVVKISPPYLQRRFANTMEHYCSGILEHVSDVFENTIPSLEDYIAIRRRGVGATPVFALVECIHRIHVPEDIYCHKSIEELRRVAIDVIWIQNDVLSYAKEQAEGVPHNLIIVLRADGMSTQRAFDFAGDMLVQCYRDWYLALASLSPFGEAIDAEVQKYVATIQNSMIASLNWQSDRYFGSNQDFVREFRRITLLEEP